MAAKLEAVLQVGAVYTEGAE